MKVGVTLRRLGMAVRRRNLTAHNELLVKVIKDQAGTLEKGVLEGVMNGLEAGSNQVRIITQQDGKSLVLEDDGKGFCSESEITEWFETFGTPHKESEGKTWARFRMGRGQLFAFGRNVWRTGEFRMVVDIREMGLEYELESGLEHFSGCRIEIDLYQPMFGDYPCHYRSLEQFKSVVRRQVLFMEGSILINDDQVNTPASTLKWDIETDEWYFSFGHGSNLDWYNMGAYVMLWSPRTAGVTGVAVSKIAVDVNFARNDIKNECPIYQSGKLIVSDNKIKKVRKAQRRLNENEKVSTLLDLRNGDCPYNDIKGLGLLMTCSGKVMSLDAIRKIRSPWTFAPQDSRVADTLQQTDQAICFSDEILGDLYYVGDQQDFFDWLLHEADMEYCNGKALSELWAPMRRFWRSFEGTEGLAFGYSLEHTIIPTNKLSKPEIRFLRVMQDLDVWNGRTLCIGISDTANGWTDSRTYIAFNRDYVKQNFPSNSWGAAAIMTLAFHEMAHDTDDTGSHLHRVEFYEAYHNLTRGPSLRWIADLAYKMRRIRWEDQATVKIQQAEKAKAKRERKLGIKAADAKRLLHTPTKVNIVKAKKKKIRRRF